MNLPSRNAHVCRCVSRCAQGILDAGLRFIVLDRRRTRTVDRQPRDQPGRAQETSEQERPMPAEPQRDPRHHQRRDDRAHVRSRIEDAGCQRALLAREPFGHGLDRSGKVARLAQAQRETRHRESQHRLHQRMAHRRQAPDRDRDRIADARSHTIDHAAGDQQSHRVGRLERRHDVAVLNLVPADDGLQIRREHAQHLPVDIVDGGGEEQQGAYPPAIGRRHLHQDAIRPYSGRSAGYSARYTSCARAYNAASSARGSTESASRIVAAQASGTDAYSPVPTIASSAAP